MYSEFVVPFFLVGFLLPFTAMFGQVVVYGIILSLLWGYDVG